MAKNQKPKPKEKLSELTLADLKKKAVKLGMPKEGAAKFDKKAPLIATIEALQATLKVKRVETLEERPDPKEDKKIEQKWQSKKDIMMKKLDEEEKVTFFIPIEGQEKPGEVEIREVNGRKEYFHIKGAVEWRCFNGYRVCVPKGVFVEIPITVANKLKEAMEETETGKKLLLDRVDPDTGRTIKEGMYHG